MIKLDIVTKDEQRIILLDSIKRVNEQIKRLGNLQSPHTTPRIRDLKQIKMNYQWYLKNIDKMSRKILMNIDLNAIQYR